MPGRPASTAGGAISATQPCPGNEGCKVDNDCQGLCKNNLCTVPNSTDGKKNNGETDIDCGGPNAPKCTPGKACDSDCSTDACFSGKCVEAKSCKRILGGNTCGTGEVEAAVKNHESCCRQLEVVGYNDPVNVGKKTYLDKYEITAGRLRTFVESVPNIKAWLLANKPAYWNDTWTLYLPEGVDGPEVAPLPNANYPNMSSSSNAGGNMGTNFAFGATM
jgi:hypothetical protein